MHLARILTTAALAFGCLGTYPRPVIAQNQDFSAVEIKVSDLGFGTYMLEGRGGNITAATAADGVILVDSQFAPLHDKLLAAIKTFSNQPVRFVIDTHFHGDHTGGNEAFAKDGAVVVAHENVKKRLEAGTVNLTGAKVPPATGAALPTRTYTTPISVELKGLSVRVENLPNAHTDGDTYVYFPRPNVIATGDIVVFGRYPFIDVANGGNIKGMIAGVDVMLALATDDAKIVPGHGPLASRAKLQEYRNLLVAARDAVARLVVANKTEDEAVAARPLTSLDGKVSADEQASAAFVRALYRSLKS
jgi:cyclase